MDSYYSSLSAIFGICLWKWKKRIIGIGFEYSEKTKVYTYWITFRQECLWSFLRRSS